MSGLAIRVRSSVGAVTSDGPHHLLGGIAPRGPDRQVATSIGPIEMAHAAFHSTPESVEEEYPGTHPTRDMWVMADARLDYRDELLDALRVAGCSFDPHTDADMILAAHEVWGDEAQTRLTGDFAYVLCDEGRILAARDVLGSKPLYWASCGADTIIASTIRCVLDQLPSVPAPNEQFIAELLCDSLSRNDHTVYEGVHRLPPGWRLRCSPGDTPDLALVDELTIGSSLDVDADQAAEIVRRSLERAVGERLRSNGGVACELSGGLDSSTIVGLVAAARPDERPLTLSNVFPGEECDESAYIADVNQRARATSHTLEPLTIEPIDLRAESARTLDIVPYPDLSRKLWMAASENGCRVVLTGQGGDEVFWHTNLYECDILSDDGLVAFARHCTNGKSSRGAVPMLKMVLLNNVLAKVPGAWRMLERSLHARRIGRLTWMTEAMTSKLRRPAPPGSSDTTSRWNKGARLHLLTNPMSVLAYEFIDQTGAGLVDVRHPFRDRKFLEEILRLPGDTLHPDGEDRFLHRKAFGDVLPSSVRDRTDQAEFSALYHAAFAKNAPNGLDALATQLLGWTTASQLSEWYADFSVTGHTSKLYPMWRSLCVSAWIHAADRVVPAGGGPSHAKLDH